MNYFLFMTENLFLFIRRSRERLWMLHWSPLNDLTKYFFIRDLLNYARLTSFQLADITKLEDDKYAGDYLKENFLVGKSEV